MRRPIGWAAGALAVGMLLFAGPSATLARGHGGHSSSSHHSGLSGLSTHGSHLSTMPSSSSHSSTSHTGIPSRSASVSRSHTSSSHRALGVPRDTHGKIARSASAKHAFRLRHPCPSTGRTSGACPGYVIDHVVALKHGGADAPSNMQWQTEAAAKAKDRWE